MYFNNGLKIPIVDNFKYLGVIIDQFVRMRPQMDRIKNIENGIMKVIKHIRATLMNVGSRLIIQKRFSK